MFFTTHMLPKYVSYLYYLLKNGFNFNNYTISVFEGGLPTVFSVLDTGSIDRAVDKLCITDI